MPPRDMADADAPPMMVVVLCAAWCRTCGEFREAFSRIERDLPAAAFVWLDIEDEAEVVGDIDVESFPTVAIYRGGRAVHFGVSLPQEFVVRRIIEAFSGGTPGEIACPPAVSTLPRRIAGR